MPREVVTYVALTLLRIYSQANSLAIGAEVYTTSGLYTVTAGNLGHVRTLFHGMSHMGFI